VRGRPDGFVERCEPAADLDHDAGIARDEPRTRLVGRGNHGLQHARRRRKVHTIADAHRALVERCIVDQDPAALRLHGAADPHFHFLFGGRVRIVLRDDAGSGRHRTVQHEAERAVGIVLAEQHHGPREVGIVELRHREQQRRRQRGPFGHGPDHTVSAY